MTTYWYYFSCIIAHNSLPVYGIPAKVGTEMRLYTPLLCAKFQGNRITRSRFIAVFVSVRKEEENNKKKKTKKLSQFLKSHISGIPEAISLEFGMWSTEVGGNVHSKICLVPSRQHRATEVRKLRFLSSCQYTHGCCAPASWAARHTTVCLDIYIYIYIVQYLKMSTVIY